MNPIRQTRRCFPWLPCLAAFGLFHSAQAVAAGAYLFQDGYVLTGGCDPTRADAPQFFLQDAGDAMRERYHQSEQIQAPSGNRSRYIGSLTLGRIFPFRTQASAVSLRGNGCNQSEAQGYTFYAFSDYIDVTAGAHPAGTPVTYTATIDMPVRIEGRGDRCPINAEFRALATLADQRAEWRQNGPYQGVQRMTVSYTAAVGERMYLYLSASGRASAVRYSTSGNICAHNEVELTDSMTITLTADVLGANTTSANGVNYRPRP